MSRLGRPAAADAHETRTRILESARRLFAQHGYDGTSNRALAEAVGLTTGALYHYFDRKLDLYIAVYEETQRVAYERFEKDIAERATFIDAVRGVLEVAHELNNEDPSLATFLGSCRTDRARNSELRAAFGSVDDARRSLFYEDLITLGLQTGEIVPEKVDQIAAVLRTVTIGLVDGLSGDRARHREAIDGILALFEGTLVRRPG